MKRVEKRWVKEAIKKGYSEEQIRNILEESNYPENTIQEMVDYFNKKTGKKVTQVTQEINQPVTKRKRQSLLKTKKGKIIILLVMAIPVYLYLLTISQEMTGTIVGLTIVALIFFGFYKAVQRKMNNEMEVIRNVRRPGETDRKEGRLGSQSQGIREREGRVVSGKRNLRGHREPERRSKIPLEHGNKVRQDESGNRRADKSDVGEYKEDRKTTEPVSTTIPSVEPVD